MLAVGVRKRTLLMTGYCLIDIEGCIYSSELEWMEG